MKTCTIAALLAVSACTIDSAMGETVTLNPTADVRILSVFPDSNEASGILSTYNSGPGNNQHTLVQFDLTSLPADMAIQSAALRLYGGSFGGGGNTSTTSVYRVGMPWNEASVTWLSSSAGMPWPQPGGDFLGTNGSPLTSPYATRTGVELNIANSLFEFDVTDMIAEFYAGTHPNFGIGLTGSVGATLVYVQSEVTGAQLQFIPALVVEYGPVPEPATFAMLLFAFPMIASRRFRRR